MQTKIYANGRFLCQELTGVQRVATEVGLRLQSHYGERLIFLCPPKPLINSSAGKFNIKIIGSSGGHYWEQIFLPLYLHKKRAPLLINFCNTAPILFFRNIVVIHDMAVRHNSAWFDKKFVLWYNVLNFFNIRLAKAIITVSNFSKSEILKYYPDTKPSRITTIYEAGFTSVNKAIFKGVRASFVVLNSINSRKDVVTVIKAFQMLDPNHFILHIIGGKNHRVFGSNETLDQRNIKFLGSLPDDQVKHEVENARALISASLYEGFSLPPLEAMSLGTPCIISRIPVHEELYSDAALFFEPGDSESLAHRLTDFNSEDLGRRSAKSFNLACKFSWDRTAAGYVEVIEKALRDLI